MFCVLCICVNLGKIAPVHVRRLSARRLRANIAFEHISVRITASNQRDAQLHNSSSSVVYYWKRDTLVRTVWSSPAHLTRRCIGVWHLCAMTQGARAQRIGGLMEHSWWTFGVAVATVVTMVALCVVCRSAMRMDLGFDNPKNVCWCGWCRMPRSQKLVCN